MQTVRNQTTHALQKLSIFPAERVQLFALGIEHSEDVAVLIPHRDNDLRPCCVKDQAESAFTAALATREIGKVRDALGQLDNSGSSPLVAR